MGLWAFDFSVGKALQVELFNGEIGYVEPHNFDRADLKKVFAGYSKKRLKRFQVKFARQEKICVNYGREIPTATRGKFTSESVENNLDRKSTSLNSSHKCATRMTTTAIKKKQRRQK